MMTGEVVGADRALEMEINAVVPNGVDVPAWQWRTTGRRPNGGDW